MSIPVYILTSNDKSEKAAKVTSLFDDDLFSVTLFKVDEPDNAENDFMDKKSFLEDNRYRKALEDAKEHHSENFVIIVKDTSVSNCDPDTIADIVEAATTDKNWDIFYLCRWLDDCALYTNKRTIENNGSQIVKTKSPFGTQAVMFTPYARDVILGDEVMRNGRYFSTKSSLGYSLNRAIGKDYLNADCVIPNVIDYDIMEAKESKDFFKSAGCRKVDNTDCNMFDENGGFSVLWFVIIIVILFFILIGLFGVKGR